MGGWSSRNNFVVSNISALEEFFSFFYVKGIEVSVENFCLVIIPFPLSLYFLFLLFFSFFGSLSCAFSTRISYNFQVLFIVNYLSKVTILF